MTFSASVLKPRIRKYIPAPILSWRMDETSGPVSDYSGNGYTGRVDGTPTRASAMENGNSGIRLKSLGDGVSIGQSQISPVISAIRNGSYSQSIVIRNMGSSGAHSPIPFVIWQSSFSGREVTLFADYVQGSGATWVHRAGWDSASATDIGNLSVSYAPSSFDSQTFVLTYVWDDVTRTKSLYRDGVLVASAVLGVDYALHSGDGGRMQVGGHLEYPSSYQVYAKLSDLNIWNVALTSGEVATLARLQGRTPDQRTNIDPYAANVVSSLLHFDGTDGSTTFTDVTGKTWTASGNAQIDTAQSKFGGASGLFDGTGDYVSTSANSAFDFGTGDFTVEAWVRIAGNSAQSADASKRHALIFSVDNGSNTIPFELAIYGDSTTTGTGLQAYNGTTAFSVTGTVSQSAWHHIALCRSGTDMRFFLNGTQMGATQTTSANFGSASQVPRIGGRPFGSNYNYYLNGWVDDLRVTKGVARYTANFTPPSAEFPNP